MIVWLVEALSELWQPLQVLRYITVRAGLAAVTAFGVCLIMGPRFISALKRAGALERAGDSDSEAAGRYAVEAGKDKTPTMGGVFWVSAVLASTLIFARADETLILLGAILLVGMGLLGFADDWLKWKSHGAQNGLSRTRKLLLTSILAVYVGCSLYWMGEQTGRPEVARIYFPVLKDWFASPAQLGSLGLPIFAGFVTLVVLAGAHSANVTDGMDGLLAGSGLITFTALTLTCYCVGHAGLAAYLHLPFIPGAGEVAVMGGALIGATLGFLWFNCYPAQVFMGDSGALPFGALIAYMAIVSKQELALPLLAGVLVLQCGSSLLQIGYFKSTRILTGSGRRLFSHAPIHHIWALRWGPSMEPRLVARFWIVAIVSAACGLLLLKLR